ncbi:MAG TPA: hypothetical protein VFL95_10150, partial [Gemmatimonadales bacterium]|nr:hypothetical protein [Gemmatimonadales bacterium]
IGPDGKLIRTIGREGEGPGEFRSTFIAVHGANLVVHDPQLSRTSVFDTSGTYLRSWASSCCYWSDITVDRAGLIYIPTSGQRNDKIRAHYIRFRLDGTTVDTIGIPDHGEEGKSWSVSGGSGGNKMMMMTAVPFTPAVRIAINPAGGAIYGWSGDYRLVVSPDGKDTARVFGRDWTAPPLAESRKDAAVDAAVTNFMHSPASWDENALRKAFHKSDIPNTVPAFESLDVDRDGNIWVRRDNGGDSTVTLLDVFDSTGAYLGPVRLGAKTEQYPGWAWGRDEVAIVEQSEDGLPIVVIYGSGMPPVGKDVAARNLSLRGGGGAADEAIP